MSPNSDTHLYITHMSYYKTINLHLKCNHIFLYLYNVKVLGMYHHYLLHHLTHEHESLIMSV